MTPARISMCQPDALCSPSGAMPAHRPPAAGSGSALARIVGRLKEHRAGVAPLAGVMDGLASDLSSGSAREPWLPGLRDPVVVLCALADRLRSDNARLERSVQELAARIPAGGSTPEARGLQTSPCRDAGEGTVHG